MNNTDGKKCIVCYRKFPLNMFYRLKNNPDGRSAICKNCCREAKKNNNLIMPVKCESCGAIKTIKICSSVRNSNCRSCGGKKANHTALYEQRYNNRGYIEQRLVNSVFNQYKKSAKKRNMRFSISKEDLKKYLYLNCYYCGRAPSNCFVCFRESSRFKQEVKYQGIDRIDSKKGYVNGNLRPCCIVCNHLKWDHTEEEFLESVKTIYERIIKNS